jgi:hypothetical protein
MKAIKVPVVISYDKKGTKQAIGGIQSLEKSFKKMGLARKLTLIGIGTAVGKFTKDSVRMALADDKANKMLTKTLKNLGLGYAALPLTDFVDKLQRATGVSEDQLRPALNKLLLATNSVTQSQKLLNLALDISATTGKSVEVTASALSKAYLGNTKALFSLGTGITKAELKSLSFEQQIAKVTSLVGGQAAVAANTYSGAVDKLTVAAKEAQETIGTALVNAIVRLDGLNGITNAATDMQHFASYTSDVITGLSILADKFSALKGSLSWLQYTGLGTAFLKLKEGPDLLAKLARNEAAAKQALNRPREGTARNEIAGLAFNKAQAAAAEKARLKAIADEQKKLLLKKQQAALDKLKAIFDMDLIQLTAAKQGKLSADELVRVNALIAAKTTAKNDDVTALNELEALQKKNADAEIARQNEILATHKRNAAEILAMNKENAKQYSEFVTTFTHSGGLFAGTPLAPKANNAVSNPPSAPAPIQTNVPNIPSMDLIDIMTPRGVAAPVAPNVTVNLQNGINIGTTQEFYESVWRAIENSNTFGNSLNRAGTG